jgi:hypothetical protein
MIYRGYDITFNNNEFSVFDGDKLLKILPKKDYCIDDVYAYIDQQTKPEEELMDIVAKKVEEQNE